MKIKGYICLTVLILNAVSLRVYSQIKDFNISFDFLGETVLLPADSSLNVPFDTVLTDENVKDFYFTINSSKYKSLVDSLLAFREKFKIDDWLYYQLIRRTAQSISPKNANYYRYTLYKWFLLNKSGYDATLSIAGNIMLFYVQSNEDIFNIPYHTKNKKQYICLNYHDYGSIDFVKTKFTEVPVSFTDEQRSFSYKVNHVPELGSANYTEKELKFDFYQQNYCLKVKLNSEVQTLFKNYPALDYSYYLNTPLSRETYLSLIPQLKKNVKGMKKKEGIDFLMRFTRYAFLFEPDIKVFGQEKRLTPEETLLYSQSDCEDRAALFFYLVKEIYNLPMIVLVYPTHVTIAVHFKKPVGNTITYNGKEYSICEPTPQRKDLKVGQQSPEFKNVPYEVVYVYNPKD